MSRGLHFTEVLPEEMRVKFQRKPYQLSKTRQKEVELRHMSRENLPEGFTPVVEMDSPSLDDLKTVTEVITDIHINKFRENKANLLLSALRCGMSVKKACSLAGITVDTYRNWYERGQQGEEPYKQFYNILEAVQLEMEQWCLNSIKASADTNRFEKTTTTVEKPNGEVQTTEVVRPSKIDWRAAAWLLEHIDPESYGKTMNDNQQAVTNNNTQIIVQLPSNGRMLDEGASNGTPVKRGRGRPKKRF